MQWCHGAPGIVAALGPLLDEDLALGGGELTWHAGPLAKGAGLCHGTSGNGYAFLVLFERTGDELWLMRARAFALHALAQLQSERYSLWTGCLGVALYLADCVDGGGPVVTRWTPERTNCLPSAVFEPAAAAVAAALAIQRAMRANA